MECLKKSGHSCICINSNAIKDQIYETKNIIFKTKGLKHCQKPNFKLELKVYISSMRVAQV